MSYQNYVLGNETSRATFNGYCRDRNGEKDIIEYIQVEDKLGCRNKCEVTKECVAYAFNRNKINSKNCDLYRNGPYIFGSGKNATTCYVMPTQFL